MGHLHFVMYCFEINYITWHLFSFNLVVSKPITIVWSISYWYESNTFGIDWWFYNFRCIFTVKNCTIWKFSECDYSLIQRHSHTHGNLYLYNEIESNSNAHDFAQLFFFMQSLEWCSITFLFIIFFIQNLHYTRNVLLLKLCFYDINWVNANNNPNVTIVFRYWIHRLKREKDVSLVWNETQTNLQNFYFFTNYFFLTYIYRNMSNFKEWDNSWTKPCRKTTNIKFHHLVTINNIFEALERKKKEIHREDIQNIWKIWKFGAFPSKSQKVWY